MPAHRSEDEQAIREAVVAKLRQCRPGARIIHEINLCGGTVRCDVMAVDVAEIITAEIKSKRDKLDRLPAQMDAMRRSSHTAIAALDRKFMPPLETLSRPLPEGVGHHDLLWWWPKPQDMAEAMHPALPWREPDLRDSLHKPLPSDAIHLLHAGELEAMCGDLQILVAGRRPTMVQRIGALRWGATGREITMGICKALRAREWAAEADPPIKGAA